MLAFHTNLITISMRRDLCEDQAWNGLRGLKIKHSVTHEIHCRGHRPSQFIADYQICNGVYDCVDRSDESGCNNDNSGSITFSPASIYFTVT